MRGPGKASIYATFEQHWIEDPITGCHLWQRSLNNKGYGVVYVRGRTRCASRIAYERRHGLLPRHLFVLHKCDTPRCVNPDHLFVGTQKDNMQDCKAKGRVGFTPHRGSANGFAKAVPVDEILAQLSNGARQRDVAKKFNVSRSTVQRVVSRTHWCIQTAAEAGAAQAGGT